MGRKIKQVNKPKKIFIFGIIILICLLLLAVFFAVKSYKDYYSLISHKDYFKNNSSIEIEPWMTPHSILRHFNITQENLFNTLNTTNSNFNFRKQISSICSEKKENCTLVIEELNSKVR